MKTGQEEPALFHIVLFLDAWLTDVKTYTEIMELLGRMD